MSFPNGELADSTVRVIASALEQSIGLHGDRLNDAVLRVIKNGSPDALPYVALTDAVAEDTGLDLSAERKIRLEAALAQLDNPFSIAL